MDYRDENPKISVWSGACIAETHNVFPFNEPEIGGVWEFIAPNAVNRFIGIWGGGDESEDCTLSSSWYLVESPLECPMRKAFVVGDVDWQDYWSHKGWLIELKKPNILEDFAYVKYIHPNNMSETGKKRLQRHSGRSPMELKHAALTSDLRWALLKKENVTEARLQLNKFEQVYGQFIQRKSA